jgi:hypothetical protein
LKIEIELHIPFYIPYINLINVKVGSRYVGYVNHIIEEKEPDVYLCSVDVQKKHEEYIMDIVNK